MKFEEIEVGKTYIDDHHSRRVVFKDDESKTVIAKITENPTPFMWREHEYEKWDESLEEEKPISRIDELIKDLRSECSNHGFDLEVIIKTK